MAIKTQYILNIRKLFLSSHLENDLQLKGGVGLGRLGQMLTDDINWSVV